MIFASFGRCGIAALSLNQPLVFAFSTLQLYFFIPAVQFFQFQIAKGFNINHVIPRFVDRPNQLVQLQIDRSRVTILSVLYQEDHEKRDNRRPGVDDELSQERPEK